MKNKKIFIGIVFYISLIFMEVIFRIFCTEHIFTVTFIHTLLYLVPISLGLSMLSSFFSEKANSIISRVLLGITTLWYCIALVYRRKLGVYFSISSLGFADQLTSFLKDTFTTIAQNIFPIILLFVPLILSIIFRKKICNQKYSSKFQLGLFGCLIISFVLFIGSLLIGKKDIYSMYDLYFKLDNHALVVEKIGVVPSTFIELRKIITGFEEKMDGNLYIPEIPNDTPVGENEEPEYNTLDIDFENLNAQKPKKRLIEMNNYFSSDPGTKKNEYTGLYEGKNLIVFMAESFNSIAVSEELTPTLYKLANEGFSFQNFYSPVILSTIGGEFQELTGLYPNLNMLSGVWRNRNVHNYYPYGFANVFKALDYNTYAYHNNQYNFQARDKYLKTLGFDNYLGCFNGLEKRINCHIWPESDSEMIEKTVTDYLNSDKPFMTYYATVSGHMGYNWGNKMAAKHRQKVEHLPYSEPVKAYIATQIELDEALSKLIEELEKSGKLDDTVIALVADHYPYDLSIEEVNEASTYKRDNVIEKNRSHFILWNSKQETVKVEKIGSQIDVLPTLLNLFGIEYDSRLIIGKDILSDTEGLAIFDNKSWVSDYGKYYTNSGKFVKTPGKEIPKYYESEEKYVEIMNKVVRSKVAMSKYILEEDYYKYVFQK